MKRIQKGFTLIELMIVVAIIGILAAVAIPAYQDYVVKAKLSKVQTTLDPIKTALALYYQENGGFPTTAFAQVATPGGAATADPAWNSIGLDRFPVIPAEVTTLDVGPGTAGDGTDIQMDLVLQGIKAATIDTKTLRLGATGGGTAIVWSCVTAGTTVTDPIALKYFGCS